MPIPPFGAPKTTTAVTQSAGNSSTKIANTQFVTTAISNAIAGVNPAVAVSAATTAAANTSGLTYNNGVSGVGATFTGTANTAITWDGFTFSALGQRGLVKNDTQSPSGAFNGIFYVTQLQTSLLPPILTRALDYDQPSDINNTGAIPVINGTVNGSTSWLLTSNVVTVGTTPLTYIQFSINPTVIMTTTTYDAAGIAQQVVGTTAVQTLTNKTLTSPTLTTPSLGIASATQINFTNNAVTASANAATVPITSRLTTVTNNAAASLAITITTTSATDGQMVIVRIYDHSAVAQTLSWVNTENSNVTVPTTSNGSTTLPLTAGFMFNSATTKWRIIALA
jgi:hypothetical protein